LAITTGTFAKKAGIRIDCNKPKKQILAKLHYEVLEGSKSSIYYGTVLLFIMRVQMRFQP
jgi:hypothetical protein